MDATPTHAARRSYRPRLRTWSRLSDLSAFCARDDLPAVAQAAVAHVQFETIHPYFDGNGRVGRASTR